MVKTGFLDHKESVDVTDGAVPVIAVSRQSVTRVIRAREGHGLHLIDTRTPLLLPH